MNNSVHWLSRLLLPVPGVVKLSVYMPELRTSLGQIALPIVWELCIVTGLLLCLQVDKNGLNAAMALQAGFLFGCFVLVDLIGIHCRGFWLRLSEKNAYRLCFWFLFTPGLMIGFFAGVAHIAIIPGDRILPIWIGVIFGIPSLLIGFLIAFRVYTTFGLDRLFYLYMFHPEDGEMAESRIYNYLRHPQYASFVYIIFGILFIKGSLESFLLSTLFFLYAVGRIFPEERELMSRFGEPYISFKKSTPAFIPKWKHSKGFLLYLIRLREV